MHGPLCLFINIIYPWSHKIVVIYYTALCFTSCTNLCFAPLPLNKFYRVNCASLLLQGYDHYYFFISTFIEDHLRFHLKNLVEI